MLVVAGLGIPDVSGIPLSRAVRSAGGAVRSRYWCQPGRAPWTRVARTGGLKRRFPLRRDAQNTRGSMLAANLLPTLGEIALARLVPGRLPRRLGGWSLVEYGFIIVLAMRFLGTPVGSGRRHGRCPRPFPAVVRLGHRLWVVIILGTPDAVLARYHLDVVVALGPQRLLGLLERLSRRDVALPAEVLVDKLPMDDARAVPNALAGQSPAPDHTLVAGPAGRGPLTADPTAIPPAAVNSKQLIHQGRSLPSVSRATGELPLVMGASICDLQIGTHP